MAIRVLYENANGRILEFSELTGIRLTTLDSISGNTIELSESTVTDQIGSSVTGKVIQPKDITLEGRYRYTPETRKMILATILPGVDARLRYVNDVEETDVYWQVTPTQTPIMNLNPIWQTFQVVVHVPYPYPRKTEQKQAEFSLKKSLFKFPFTYPTEKPFRISSLIAQPLISIENEGDLESGFLIRMTANADGITGPYLINVDTQEGLRFSELTLNAGQALEICTKPNEKYAHLILDGSITNAFAMMDYSSVFFQLTPGLNNIRAGASTNETQLETVLYFNEIMPGV